MDNPYSTPVPSQTPYSEPQYQKPQYQAPQYPQYPEQQYPQYQAPQYLQYPQQQYLQPQPPRTELINALAPEDKKISTWAFYRPLIRWGWIILAVSGGISLLTLALVAGGVI